MLIGRNIDLLRVFIITIADVHIVLHFFCKLHLRFFGVASSIDLTKLDMGNEGLNSHLIIFTLVLQETIMVNCDFLSIGVVLCTLVLYFMKGLSNMVVFRSKRHCR
ncbi:hypothetical protein BJ912DRAFT_973534 [Pholiota molesta]|nr:hypothetical protein BJ912DRAFT_1002356 [Pholiota molesta]KAF8185466.1 hypothetical protein BJ912DRAFT_973534 [Pholiota molesta]